MVDAVVDYTYEYQGNGPKLVHTPLTDKCYMVLTQGLSMGLGGNPYGPAGTGKTESVKALGAAIGRQVLVFNCDEAIDYLSMGRILIGIVKCGAWGCFDEFNRLKEDQLSAISQQIQVRAGCCGGGGRGGGMRVSADPTPSACPRDRSSKPPSRSGSPACRCCRWTWTSTSTRACLSR
jgi:hypothetical protein